MSRSFTFIGVTTGGSSIMRIFPRWRDLLGLGSDVEMAGWDIELDAPPRKHREAVARIAEDVSNLGALVTTHKVGVFQAAGNLFDELDRNAHLCAEISCIAKRDGRLTGSATDPVAAGRSLETLLQADHFTASGAEVLCMGAGGAGVAIAVYLAAIRPDSPGRIVLTDISSERLERLDQIADRAGIREILEPILIDQPDGNDRLLASLRPRSLVINATGMGKDRPGSPLSPQAPFPEGAGAWELNYRGDLEFLRQAEEQKDERGLVVEDGWRYFIRGWAAVIEEVFERPIDDGEIELLSREAEFARPRRKEE